MKIGNTDVVKKKKKRMALTDKSQMCDISTWPFLLNYKNLHA